MSCKNPNGMILLNNLTATESAVLSNRKFKISNDKLVATKFFKLPDRFENHQEEIIKSLVPSFLVNKAELLQIPCGNCLACRLDYSKYWASRCFGESLYHENNYFITLTYDDDHLPKGVINNPSLIKSDLQKFIKALRNYGFKDVRYFACGEYGDNTHRPHYHVILYNVNLPDLTNFIPYFDDYGIKHYTTKVDENGDSLFYSDIIFNAWHRKGNIIIGRVTYKSCAYVARYVVKKSKGVTKDVYTKLGIESEFVLMSRRPGIGCQYILDHYESLKDNPSIYIPGQKPFLSGFGKYFTKIQKSIDYDKYLERKAYSIRNSIDNLELRSKISSRSINSQNKDELLQLEEKTKILKRSNLNLD